MDGRRLGRLELNDLQAAGSQGLAGLGSEAAGYEHLDPMSDDHLRRLNSGPLRQVLIDRIIQKAAGLCLGIEDDKPRSTTEPWLKGAVQGRALG
jgi:hypothetical protein